MYLFGDISAFSEDCLSLFLDLINELTSNMELFEPSPLNTAEAELIAPQNDQFLL